MTDAPRVADAQTAARLTTEWDAALYFKFGAERAQPPLDLVTRIDFTPKRIVDLGCGPGVSTRMLRFPSWRTAMRPASKYVMLPSIRTRRVCSSTS